MMGCTGVQDPGNGWVRGVGLVSVVDGVGILDDRIGILSHKKLGNFNF